MFISKYISFHLMKVFDSFVFEHVRKFTFTTCQIVETIWIRTALQIATVN